MKQTIVSKSQFKAKALEYMRWVENKNQVLIVTDMGQPVIKIIPYREKTLDERLAYFRGSILKYERPMDPVGLEDWEVLK